MKTKITYLKKYLILPILLIFPIILAAQTTCPKAEQKMDRFEYQEAIQLYLQHFQTNTPNAQDIRNITYCYMMGNDTKSAVYWLSKVVKTAFVTGEDCRIYADLLKSEGQYSEATHYYEKYAELSPDGKDYAEKNIEMCSLALDWTYEPEYFTITNVQSLNSDKSDFGLMPFKGEFVYTSDRIVKNNPNEADIYGWTGNAYLQMYSVDFNESDFSAKKTKSITKLNNNFHNGPAVYDEKSNTLYFTRTKVVKQIQKPVNPDPTSWFADTSDELFTNRLEIYSSKYVDGNWEDPVEFKHNNTSMFSVGHPTLSPDGQTLYFVSDMPGGKGLTDIWYCEKKADGTWDDPRNAGKEINTAGKEMFPYVDKDGILFFSSDGLPGMGGLDLFKTTGKKKSWEEPENLRYPINSPKDDFSVYVVEDGQLGYFSSNRYGGQGSDDIYSFVYSPPTDIILAVTTKEILEDGKIIPLEGVNVDVIKGEIIVSSLIEESPGQYYETLDCNESYMIHGFKKEFFTQSKSIETICETKHDTVYVELVLERIVIDKPIVIENIYYDFDKWNIRPDAAIELDKIVALLVANPHIIIELGSHTDARGTFRYNDILSQKRAESAVQYIIDNGISNDRISAKGYGENIPVNECVDGVKCDEDAHQLNRRTEFKVTGYSETQPVIYSAKD